MTRYLRKHHQLLPAGAMAATIGLGYAIRAAEQVLRGNRQRAREHWAYALGSFTARATVGGRVVTGGPGA